MHYSNGMVFGWWEYTFQGKKIDFLHFLHRGDLVYSLLFNIVTMDEKKDKK